MALSGQVPPRIDHQEVYETVAAIATAARECVCREVEVKKQSARCHSKSKARRTGGRDGY